MSNDTRQLKQFAIGALVYLPLAAWLSAAGRVWFGAAVAIGVVAMGLAWYAPAWLTPVYEWLIKLTRPMGRIVGEVSLLLIFVGVFVPISLLFRLIGRDALQRRCRRESETYWQIVPDDSRAEQYWRRY